MAQARTLDEPELARVLAHIETGRHAHRNRAMLLLTHWAGLRVGEVAVRTLDQQQVPELHRIAQIGKVVGAAPPALHLAGEGKPELTLPDQVQRLIGQRDILFQHRGMAAPFRDAVAQHQAAVAHPAEPVEERGPVDRCRRLGHHMCPTSSGMSKKVGCR